MENTSGEKKSSYMSQQSGDIILKSISEYTKYEEVLKIMEDYTKICRFGPQWGTIEH